MSKTAPIPLLASVLVSLCALRPNPPALPTQIRTILDSEHPHWRFATVDTGEQRNLRPGERPDWVSGDLDADGKADYVVQIIDTGRTPNFRQLVLGFLRRDTGYLNVPIDSGPPSQDTYLRVNVRGSRGFDIETHEWFAYPTDVLSILDDQTAGKDCPYRSGRFECFISGD